MFYPIDAGVSPTLFIIFINDLLSCTDNSIHSYADDSSIHCSYKLPNNHTSVDVRLARKIMADSLNLDLIKIVEWSKINLVSFNHSKTQSCFFF